MKWKSVVTAIGLVIGIMMMPVSATALTVLTYDDTLKDIQQTDNSPCVIGSPSCASGDVLPFTSVEGGPGDQDLNSPTYTVGQITGVVGSDFMNLLIDVNQSCGSAEGCPITLDLVEVFVDGNLEFVFTGPQFVPLAGSLSGNGFSDAGLKTLDFSSFDDTDSVLFHIVWSNQSDGQESFFLASTTAPPCTENCFPEVPEPSTLILMGMGLVFIPVVARRFPRRIN
jgi:hypothetical protein